MPPRVSPIELTVQHVRQPCQGIPIVGVGTGESPDGAFPSQACLKMRIFRHVLVVVVVDESGNLAQSGHAMRYL